MKISPAATGLLHSRRFLTAAAVALILFSIFLAFAHATALRNMSAALPIAARIPALEARLTILRQQAEVAELHAALRIGSDEERLRVAVLPKGGDLDRLLAFFEILRSSLEKERHLRSMSPVEISEREETTVGGAELFVQEVTLEAELTHDGVEMLTASIGLMGHLTLGDVFTTEERDELFRKTESENPAGIVQLEQFLATDVLAYSKDTRIAEEYLRRAFSPKGFASLQTVVSSSEELASAIAILQGPIGQRLSSATLWPLQYASIQKAAVRELPAGTFQVELTIAVYSR